MGAATGCIERLVSSAPPTDPTWSLLHGIPLYSFLTSEGVFRQQSVLTAASSVCKNTLTTRVLWRVAEKAVDVTDLPLSTNLMLMLRAFFGVVFAERIPYNFVYMSENAGEPVDSPTGLSTSVPITFHFQELSKTLQIAIPHNADSDLRTEANRLTQEVARNFESLREVMRAQGERIVFADEAHTVVDMQSIVKYFSDGGEHMHLWIKTIECDLVGEMSAFLTRLVNLYLSLLAQPSSEPVLRAKHAAMLCFVTLLSSQLFYTRKQARPGYFDFKISPAVDILFNLPDNTVSQLICGLLQEFVSSYKWLPSSESYVGQVVNALWTSEHTNSDFIRDEMGTAALVLSLLLLNYESVLPNPFPRTDLHSVAMSVQTRILRLMDDTNSLVLLLVLLRDNEQFRRSFVSTAEHDRYLPKLCDVVYTADLRDVEKVYLVLNLFLVLSEDSAFVRFLNTEVTLGEVDWLPHYNTGEMSLGSLLLLVSVRIFKDNLIVKDSYLHAIAVSLIYNLSTDALKLHEVTAQYVLGTLVTLWKRVRLNNEAQAELELFLDLFGHLLQNTYRESPWLVYMTLREAETFEQLASSGLAWGVLENVGSLIAFFMERVTGEHIIDDVERLADRYELPKCMTFTVLKDVIRFEVGRDRTWEQWTIPLVWASAKRRGLLRVEPTLMRLTVF